MSSSVFVRRAARALLVACVVLGSVGARAALAGIQVDDDKAQCPKAGFRTISRALEFAPPGATVRVCPGTYAEHVRMAKPGVRVVGQTGNPVDVILRAPAGPSAGVDMLAPATSIEAVTLRPSTRVGIFVLNGVGPFAAASVIANVRIRKNGGFGVIVGEFRFPTNRPARAVIRDSRYSGNGLGILLAGGSRASIHDNVLVGTNGRGGGIAAISGRVDIAHNDVSAFKFPGHDSVPSIGIQLQGDDIAGRVTGNVVHDNALGLLISLSAHDLTVSDNSIRDNLAGIETLSPASGYRFVSNIVTNNKFGDCLDFTLGTGTAGTANTWTDNIGPVSTPRGICRSPAAVTVQVDDDKAQCPQAEYTTIAQALADVPPGSTILVCPGEYSGPLRMATPGGVRVVGLTGRRSDVVVLPAEGDPSTPIVEMSVGATTLANLTLRDRLPARGNCFHVGVLVDNGSPPFLDASVIDNVTVRQASECATPDIGVGIAIGAFEQQSVPPGRAVVQNSTIVARSEGVLITGDSTAGIRHNVIQGLTPRPAGGAITIQPGGPVRVVRNDLSGYHAGVVGASAQAMIGVGPRNGNNIHDNEIGVTLNGGGTVADNDIHHNKRDGVFVFGSDSVVARNRIHDNGGNGILVQPPASGNRFVRNVVTNDGLGNPQVEDCIDVTTGAGTAGTANTWIDNIGAISSPPGICRPPEPASAPTSPPTTELPTPPTAAGAAAAGRPPA